MSLPYKVMSKFDKFVDITFDDFYSTLEVLFPNTAIQMQKLRIENVQKLKVKITYKNNQATKLCMHHTSEPGKILIKTLFTPDYKLHYHIHTQLGTSPMLHTEYSDCLDF